NGKSVAFFVAKGLLSQTPFCDKNRGALPLQRIDRFILAVHVYIVQRIFEPYNFFVGTVLTWSFAAAGKATL
ncbi:hypothetical protein, partial [Streptococcus anginosus]